MKNHRKPKFGPSRETAFLWRALATALMSLSALMGYANQNGVEGNFELPEFEVKPQDLDLSLTLPVLSKMIVPRLRSNLRGTEVCMTFYIDKKGQVYSVQHDASPYDDRESQVGEAMKQKLKSWRFAPAVNKQGDSAVVKVALPVKVVAPGKGISAKYANISISEPVLLAVLDK